MDSPTIVDVNIGHNKSRETHITYQAVKMSRPVQPLLGQLGSLSLDNVEETGKAIGRGAYGVVFEVKVSGLVCAGKTLHEAILQVYIYI